MRTLTNGSVILDISIVIKRYMLVFQLACTLSLSITSGDFLQDIGGLRRKGIAMFIKKIKRACFCKLLKKGSKLIVFLNQLLGVKVDELHPK